MLLLLTRPFHFVWSGWQYYYLTYTSNLALWRTAVPLQLSFFNIRHFWSLQVEEQFYLIWPLVIYRVRRPGAIVRISLISCATILAIRIFLIAMRSLPAFSYLYLPYSPTFSCADNILFGCALSALMRTRWRKTALSFAPRILVISAAVLLIAALFNHGLDWANNFSPVAHFFIPTLGFTLIGISCTAVIAMTLQPASMTQSFFRSPFLRFLGRYSYGIYVFHWSIHGLLTEPLRLFLNTNLHSKALSVCIAGFIVGALSILIALLSYHLYEVQFLHLKRFFNYNRTSTNSPVLESS